MKTMPAFDTLTLASPRLRLRPLVAADAQALFDIFSDTITMRYWSTPPWPDISHAEKMIATDVAAMPAGEHLRLAMTRPEADIVIGICTLFAFDLQNRRAEIGYGLKRELRGQGLMHEALCTLIAFGFDELDLRRLEADIDPRNTASARSLERLGFVKEGHLRERWIVGGEVSDTGLYGLLRKDWKPPGPCRNE